MPLHVEIQVDATQKHEYDINHLLFQKGKLYSAADDGKIKVWDSDLNFLQEIQAHPSSVFSLAASVDTLYSCSNDGTVKSWNLDNLQEKQTLIQEENEEFWKLFFRDDVLYVGDDQGNCRIYKNEKFFGSINVAIPVKDLAVTKNLVFASKDIEIIVTNLKLQGDKPSFSLIATIIGRGPLALADNKAVFFSRDGRDIILNAIGEDQKLKELKQINGAHEMIVNAATTINWNGSSLLFTGGWDKVVKQWKIENDSLHADGFNNVDFVITAMAGGENGTIYVGGSEGHLARLDI